MIVVRITDQGVVYLYDGRFHHITSPSNELAFSKVLPVVEIDMAQFNELSGGTNPQ